MGEYNITSSVFPIYQMQRSQKGEYSDGYFKGTCFCTIISNMRLLISAKHVLSTTEQDVELAVFMPSLNNKVEIIKIEALRVDNKLEDFSFIIPIGKFKEFLYNSATPLEFLREKLELGANIVSYGFPLSNREINLDNSTLLTIVPMVFRGYIQGVWKDLERNNFNNIYAVSFPSLPGLSGAPLLFEKDDRLLIAGILHEHRSVGRIPINETIIDGNITERHFRSYEIGISSDYKPFIEIEKLIVEKGLEERTKRL